MIKVLRAWDGFTGEIVEEIDRKGRTFGKGHGNKRWEVSYKGKWEVVFNLPKVYGELEGACISID